jgi:hypothetical protein
MYLLFTARTSELFLYMVLLNASPRPSGKNARVFQLVDSTRSDCAIIIIYFSQMHSIEENGKNCVSHDHMKNLLSAVESACFWRIILAGLSTIQGQYLPKHSASQQMRKQVFLATNLLRILCVICSKKSILK